MSSRNTSKDRFGAKNGDVQDSILSITTLRQYLTLEEELEIDQHFKSSVWRPDKQVLWSGMLREDAQIWADEHEMQTLTTVMGLLLSPNSPRRPGKIAPDLGWSRYIHGASALFASHIACGNKVTVLSPPPPQRFHASGLSSFQTIELPILTAAIVKGVSLRIEIVHPGVTGAENWRYQLWPVDEVARWTAVFQTAPRREVRWRPVKVKGRERGVSVEQAFSQTRQEKDKTGSKSSSAPVTKAVECKLPKNVDSRSAHKEKSDILKQACSKPNPKKSKRKKKKGGRTVDTDAIVDECASMTKEVLYGGKGNMSRPLSARLSVTQHQPSNVRIAELPHGPIASRTRSKTKAARESGTFVYLAL